MKKTMLAGLMAIAVTMAPTAVSAAPFVGTVGYSGHWSLPNALGFDDNTDLTILSAFVLNASGTFAFEGLALGNPLIHTSPLTYRPAPVIPAGNLWTHAPSGISFVATSFSATFSDLSIDLGGAGYFTGAGYAETLGVWTLTAQRADSSILTGTFEGTSWVDSPVSAAVPEPATIALLGFGLVGVGAARRRTRR